MIIHEIVEVILINPECPSKRSGVVKQYIVDSVDGVTIIFSKFIFDYVICKQFLIGVRKGDILVYPAFLKHLDPNLFGSNPYQYEYDRFVKKPNQPKVPAIMIFGCGTHSCPGQFWVMNQTKILLALIIQHMNIELINMTEKDKEDYRKRLPYDYSKFGAASGPRKGYEHKFDIKYSYKNLHTE